MGAKQKNKNQQTVQSAVDDLFRSCSILVEHGFILTGAIMVVRHKGDGLNQQAIKHVTQDGRVGTLRFLPPANAKGSIIDQSNPPPLPINVPANLSKPMTPETAAIVLTADSVRKGEVYNQVPSGDVCAGCGSSNLLRSGTCETCQDCGSTTGCG